MITSIRADVAPATVPSTSTGFGTFRATDAPAPVALSAGPSMGSRTGYSSLTAALRAVSHLTRGEGAGAAIVADGDRFQAVQVQASAPDGGPASPFAFEGIEHLTRESAGPEASTLQMLVDGSRVFSYSAPNVTPRGDDTAAPQETKEQPGEREYFAHVRTGWSDGFGGSPDGRTKEAFFFLGAKLGDAAGYAEKNDAITAASELTSGEAADVAALVQDGDRWFVRDLDAATSKTWNGEPEQELFAPLRWDSDRRGRYAHVDAKTWEGDMELIDGDTYWNNFSGESYVGSVEDAWEM